MRVVPASIMSFRANSRFLGDQVRVGDTHVHASWLRDHCMCKRCVDPTSKQKLHSSASWWPAPTAHSAQLKGGHVDVDWGGQHGPSTYSIEEISRHSNSGLAGGDGVRAMAARMKAVSFMQQPRVRFLDLQSSPAARAWALHTLHGSGLIVVDQVGTNGVTDVAQCIGPVMDTFYGRDWDVRAEEGATNLAYSSQELVWHQDLLYFESPPGLQFLHCLVQAHTGGHTLFLDGVAAAARFEEAFPDHFALLSSCELPYHYHAAGMSLEQHRPVFGRATSPDSHRLVWWSPHWLAPFGPHIGTASFYEAMNTWESFLHSQPQLAVRLEPGMCVVFDNQRMFHARRAFEGARHLRGCYVSKDAFREALFGPQGAISFRDFISSTQHGQTLGRD